MNKVPYYPIPLATAATGSNTIFVGNSEQIMVYIPAVSSVFASGTIVMSMLGAYEVGVTARQSNYWDYGNATPKSCVVTLSTGGVYELPNGGGCPYVRISFDVATVQSMTVSMMTPKQTF